MIEAYERQPGETATAFSWFAAYRSLDPRERSLQRLISDADRSEGAPKVPQLTVLKRWSRKHGWVDRAAAWDSRLDGHRRDETLAAAARAAELHALTAGVFPDAATFPVRFVLEELRERMGDPVRSEELRREYREMDVRELTDRLAALVPPRFAPALADWWRASLGWAQEIKAQVEVAPDLTGVDRGDRRDPDGIDRSDPKLWRRTDPANVGAVLAALEDAGYGGVPEEYIRRQAEQFGWIADDGEDESR